MRSIIGWEEYTPVPDGTEFTDYLRVKNGDLHFEALNLADLFRRSKYQTPLETVYLPLIRRQIKKLQDVFDDSIAQLKYEGRFYYAYASKANAAEEVIRTIMGTHAHHEMSSAMDVQIARIMFHSGLLTKDKMVLANGFKGPGTPYAEDLILFQSEHGNVIPILESLDEIQPFIDSGLPFKIGLRQKSYGSARDLAGLDQVNSRFGMHRETIFQAIEMIDAAPNLELVMLHAMAGSQIIDEYNFVERLVPSIELYAQIKKIAPSLHIFNFGGGIPVEMTLDFDFNYGGFVRYLLDTCMRITEDAGVPPPDIMGEMGRYTVAEHGAHLFKIQQVKENNSHFPWYIIDGSIMSSFPDSWALGELFTVLPLNFLDRPFQRVQLGGITCDSDDMYPRDPDQVPLFLPEIKSGETLYIGFFSVGAYQEMLGGAGGSKHCVLPEAGELIIDYDPHQPDDVAYIFEYLPHQSATQLLSNLGYKL